MGTLPPETALSLAPIVYTGPMSEAEPVRVAIVACRNADDAAPTDLYPDEDWPLLETALGGAGAAAEHISWDDEGIDWGRFDLAVVNSTWDSVDRPEPYLAWANRTARATTLLNPPAALAWNLDKTYLRGLQARGVPAVPTGWVVDEARWSAPSSEFVVKPSISAGGRSTARYRPDEAAAARVHVGRLLKVGQTVMVQPYMASVDVEGEMKLVFVEGVFSHAVRVGPLLESGAGVVERPWEKHVSMEAATPTEGQLAAAHRVLAAVDAEVRTQLLYARVDLVTGPAGEPLLSEVEVVDPSLLLRFVPAAAGRFADAIVARARRERQ